MAEVDSLIESANAPQTLMTAPPVVAAPPLVLPSWMERRRPGRREKIYAALIPLLRRKPDQDTLLPAFDLEEERFADRAPSRGIIIGIGISALVWVAGILAVAVALY